jgi:hypothetical protein
MEDDHRCIKIDQLFSEGQFTPLDFYKDVNYPIDERDKAQKHLKNALTSILVRPTKYKSDSTDIKKYIDKVGNVNLIFKNKMEIIVLKLLINIAQPEYRLLHTRVAKICRIYNI